MADTQVVVTQIGAGTVTIEDTNPAVVSPTTVQPTVTVDQQTNQLQVVQEAGPTLLVQTATLPLTLTEESTDVVEIITAGPQGPQGPQGTSGDAHYVHNQVTPSASWTITHNLGKMPSVTIVDSADTEVEGDIQYTSVNQVVVTFSGAFSGKAYFN